MEVALVRGEEEGARETRDCERERGCGREGEDGRRRERERTLP